MLGLPLLLGKGRRGCGAGYRVAGPQRDWHGRRTAPLRKENTPAGRPIPKVAQIPERGWLTRERAAAFGCRAVNDSSRRTAMSPRLKPSPRIRCLTKSLRGSRCRAIPRGPDPVTEPKRYLMAPNIGSIDRALRSIVGIALIAPAVTGTIGSWGCIGIVPLATALPGWCPAGRSGVRSLCPR